MLGWCFYLLFRLWDVKNCKNQKSLQHNSRFFPTGPIKSCLLLSARLLGMYLVLHQACTWSDGWVTDQISELAWHQATQLECQPPSGGRATQHHHMRNTVSPYKAMTCFHVRHIGWLANGSRTDFVTFHHWNAGLKTDLDWLVMLGKVKSE